MPLLSWNGKHIPTIEPFVPQSLETWGDECKHTLHCGDNLQWMSYATQQTRRFDLIYLDPPFCSQANYTQNIDINGTRHTVEGFSDIFSVDNYLQFIYERVFLLHTLLQETGSIFLHCDYQQSHHLRAILDEIFGASQYRNDIIWHYTGGGRSKRYFSRKHDTIFWYSKTDEWTFNPDAIRVPYKATSGFAKGGITSKSGKKYTPNPNGTIPDDTWDIAMLNPLAKERNGYPTQKPLELLNRILLACSNEGDQILDPFMGSGTTGISAIQNNRYFTGVDRNWNSLHMMRKRLCQTETSFDISFVEAAHYGEIDRLEVRFQANSLAIVQAFLNHQMTPFQYAYGRTRNGTWVSLQENVQFNLIRVIGLQGGMYDFNIPSSVYDDPTPQQLHLKVRTSS